MNNIEEIFKLYGFIKTKKVKYTTEFKNEDLFIYLVNAQPLSIVISPNIRKSILDKYNGYLYHASSLRQFPKRYNNGETMIHYGYKINFTNKFEFKNFLEDFIKN